MTARPVAGICAPVPVLLGVLLGCGHNDHPAGGPVPAPLRDTESASEALVEASFGTRPDRLADWTRAPAVLGRLSAAWQEARTTSSLPPEPAGRVDAALARARTTIAAQAQADAVQASNAVFRGTVDLFASFELDIPLAVSRLDVELEQTSIDAHFGGWPAAEADLTTVRGLWSSMEPDARGKAPGCHRVAGAATVGDDFAATLGALGDAVAGQDGPGAEEAAERGLDEVDTLELLFACPPDGSAPAHGLGARCASDGECGAGQICNREVAGGTCGPDPARATIGAPCTSTSQCGGDRRAACNTVESDAFPGGYCSMEPCNDIQICPTGATCVSLGLETPACLKSCMTDQDCRTAEGYVCQLFVVAPPSGYGPSEWACAFPCTRAADCPDPLRCDVASGKCQR